MEFLNACADGGGDDPFCIGLTLKLASTPSGQDNGAQTPRLGAFQGVDQVGGIATGGEKDKNVTGLSEGFHLSGENFLKTKIIGNAGQCRPVRCQGECGKRAPIILVTSG